MVATRWTADRIRFDSKKIFDFLDDKEVKSLNRIGSLSRTIARRKILKQKKNVIKGRSRRVPVGDLPPRGEGGRSRPRIRVRVRDKPQKGLPPRWRRRGPRTLKDEIWYAFDTVRRELFVGPILFSRKRQQGQTVPQWLENSGFAFMRPTLADLLSQRAIPRAYASS